MTSTSQPYFYIDVKIISWGQRQPLIVQAKKTFTQERIFRKSSFFSEVSSSCISRGFQTSVYRFGPPNYMSKTVQNNKLFNHIFNTNASTLSQTFSVSNALKIDLMYVLCKTLCMPVSAAQICLNVSQSIVCINKSSLYIVAVSLNLPLYTALSSFKSVAMFKRDHIKNVDLTLSRRTPLSYRNQSIDLLPKSMDWFLYDNGLRLERVKWKSSKVNDFFISIAMHFFQYKLSQSAITCSKLTIETLDQGEICSKLTIKTPGPRQ